MAEKYLAVGKIGKPHGIAGAFRFLLWRTLKSNRKTPPHFMLLQKGHYTPYFIEHIEWQDWESGFIKFEEITSPEQAKQYSGSELFITPADADRYFKKDANELQELLHYQLHDTTSGITGEVIELNETLAQILVTIKGPEREHLIPLAEDFIVEINKRKKIIIATLPEGLLDL